MVAMYSQCTYNFVSNYTLEKPSCLLRAINRFTVTILIHRSLLRKAHMSSFADVFSVKASVKLSVKKKTVWHFGAKRFKLGKGGKAFCKDLLEVVHTSDEPRGTTQSEIAPSLPQNYAVGWNDQSSSLSRMCLNRFQQRFA